MKRTSRAWRITLLTLGVSLLLYIDSSVAQQAIMDACGTLVPCIEPGTIFVPLDASTGPVLTDYGHFQPGDTVRVVGAMFFCVNFCFAPCVDNWWIGRCCAVSITGDVDANAVINSGDIIRCVNYQFKGGPAPRPCEAAGDANCDGKNTSSDILCLVNHVLKSGPPPCDVCTLVPDIWTCL